MDVRIRVHLTNKHPETTPPSPFTNRGKKQFGEKEFPEIRSKKRKENLSFDIFFFSPTHLFI